VGASAPAEEEELLGLEALELIKEEGLVAMAILYPRFILMVEAEEARARAAALPVPAAAKVPATTATPQRTAISPAAEAVVDFNTKYHLIHQPHLTSPAQALRVPSLFPLQVDQSLQHLHRPRLRRPCGSMAFSQLQTTVFRVYMFLEVLRRHGT
jgi:hypothetical protein